ncbi:P pilus assembly protein, chaperone PapD [Nostoc minutum NIES-26]|uniref:P pilus assembly protein, chaperone PapD n=1 Tax=Nostoc minutum NIES-26 TaxID=1844469 RepID=A0A367S034_9NOSO|nr:fimbria/pilus periplasmic chaperone [Dendronalium sp. ChiSLP03b]MDZ8206862.1 fimbria/pilus periplasmic chaperone [Dendronalium sp. ChiSLP03b]RCJ42207.1 P pilus assembly protein, chaperone PapD [Nostoc minutum NIES-26]
MFRKATTLALSLIGAFVLGIPSATALNIGVSPARIELEINRKTRTQAIRVLNMSSEPIELKAYVRTWKMSEDNKLVEVPPTEESLEQWVVFTPSQFTIPGRSAQTIRFAIRPRIQPKSGEHRAVIYFQEIPATNEKVKDVRTVGRIGVVLYGYVGDIKRVGVVNSITVDSKPNGATALFDVSSKGTGYVRLNGQYGIWPAAKYPGANATKPINDVEKPGKKLPENVLAAGTLPLLPVLPDTRRRLQLPIPKTLAPGKYVLDINGELNGVKINQGIPFVIPEATANASNQTKPAARNLRNRLQKK